MPVTQRFSKLACLLFGVSGTVLFVPYTAPSAVAVRPTAQIDNNTVELAQSKITRELNRLNTPGYAIAVVNADKVVFAKYYGMADLEREKPVTADTIFGIASLTKTFTAAVLLSLADEGKIKLDSKIGRYMPDAPAAWKELTVHQLATMTAGIAPGITEEREWPKQMEIMGAMPLLNKPGTTFQYSNPSYRLLGTLIERVTGEPYETAVKERILIPLRMQSTAPISELRTSPHFAYPYAHRNGAIISVKHKSPALSFASGMFASSMRDMLKYASALLAQDIRLSRSSYNKLFNARPALSSGERPQWAFGWRIYRDTKTGTRFIAMTGGDPGVASTLILIPEKKIAIVAMANVSSKALQDIPFEVARLFADPSQSAYQAALQR